MKEIIVNDILEKCNGRLICGNKNDICTNFNRDTREIKNGDTSEYLHFIFIISLIKMNLTFLAAAPFPSIQSM